MYKSLERTLSIAAILAASWLPLSCASTPKKQAAIAERTPIILPVEETQTENPITIKPDLETRTQFHANQKSISQLKSFEEIQPQLLTAKTKKNYIWMPEGRKISKGILGLDPMSVQEGFISQTELWQVFRKIENIPYYNSFQELAAEFSKNSFRGKVWALANIDALLFHYNYDIKRDHTELITGDQIFEALKESYTKKETTPIGKCAHFSYSITKIGQEMGLKVYEMGVAFAGNLGGHMDPLIYDEEEGYVIINKRKILFTNTHNRKIAEKLWQQEHDFVHFQSTIFHEDNGLIFTEPTDEGKLIFQAWEYDKTPENFKKGFLDENKKNTPTGIDTEESSQYSSIRFNIENLFFKQGHFQGDELSSLEKSTFTLTGFEIPSRIIDVKGAIGLVNFRIASENYFDLIASGEIGLSPTFQITDKYSITPKISAEGVGGLTEFLSLIGSMYELPIKFLDEGLEKTHIKFPSQSNNFYLGISENIQLSRFWQSDNYIFGKAKIEGGPSNQQRPIRLYPWALHVGKNWEFERGSNQLEINPEAFISKPAWGLSLDFSLDLDTRFQISIGGLYSRSLIPPITPDTIGLNGRISIKPGNFEFYAEANYEKEFWPVTPIETYSLSTGIQTQLLN